jgi:hypothetical protein
VITHSGGCHCGRVRFEVIAPKSLAVLECNCSICSKAGYLHLLVPVDRFKLLTGDDALKTYSFNTHTAKHLFCSVCGIKSFYVPRSHPDGISVNARCIDSETIEELTVEPLNGREWEAQYRKVEASTQSDNTMLTIDDVQAIPLFSTLAATELQRLAATSADLHLGAGEFAVPEGGDRALYAVLAGKMQVVKRVDGIERTLGWRVPGQIFGEVPIAFGTTFAGGYRASEPSRVLRVDPKEYRCGGGAGGFGEGWCAGARADRWASGHRCRTAQAARDDDRQSLGCRLQ